MVSLRVQDAENVHGALTVDDQHVVVALELKAS